MRNSLSLHIRKSALLLAALLATTGIASAQALITAGRGAEFAPFAQVTYVNTDWGPSSYGYTAGIDYTRFIRSIVQPSIEFRMTSVNASSVNERTYTGGLKLQTTVHHVHPYATLLAGCGTLALTQAEGTYNGDNAIVYSFGGGADFNVTSLLKLRLDVSHQQWNLGDAPLTPFTVGVGVSYSLPFHTGRVR
jgi:hypothetical protein